MPMTMPVPPFEGVGSAYSKPRVAWATSDRRPAMRRRSSGDGDGRADPPLIGREGDLARITAALHGGTVAVLLTGAAGVGKTRLAEECLSRLAPRASRSLRVLATRSAAT